MKNNLLSRLEDKSIKYSKSHRKIADFIITNYDKAAFMTAAALGEKVGVSESTVVRFASELALRVIPKCKKSFSK